MIPESIVDEYTTKKHLTREEFYLMIRTEASSLYEGRNADIVIIMDELVNEYYAIGMDNNRTMMALGNLMVSDAMKMNDVLSGYADV